MLVDESKRLWAGGWLEKIHEGDVLEVITRQADGINRKDPSSDCRGEMIKAGFSVCWLGGAGRKL